MLKVPIENLHLDAYNPRLPEDSQGKSEGELLKILYKGFALRELAESMVRNGYFEEEPLVVVPENLPERFKSISYDDLKNDPDFETFINDPKTNFVVIEGNRRLATAKILLSQELREELKIREWPEPPSPEYITNILSQLPVIVYPDRKDVIPYLGVRHITGVVKWNPYPKARYIANMIKQNYTIDQIQQKIGDRGSVRQSYLCYKLVQAMEEESEGSGEKAKELFSYLLLSIRQNPIKEYLGIPRDLSQVNLEDPIPRDKIRNLRNLFSFLFGEGKEKRQVIDESRDITNKLTDVLLSSDATEYLIETRDLDGAYERSDGEEKLILNRLKRANRDLEIALGIIHRQRTEQVIEEANKLRETLGQIFKNLNLED
jgi:hypothetical protein